VYTLYIGSLLFITVSSFYLVNTLFDIWHLIFWYTSQLLYNLCNVSMCTLNIHVVMFIIKFNSWPWVSLSPSFQLIDILPHPRLMHLRKAWLYSYYNVIRDTYYLHNWLINRVGDVIVFVHLYGWIDNEQQNAPAYQVRYSGRTVDMF